VRTESNQALWYPKATATKEVGYFVEDKDIYYNKKSVTLVALQSYVHGNLVRCLN